MMKFNHYVLKSLPLILMTLLPHISACAKKTNTSIPASTSTVQGLPAGKVSIVAQGTKPSTSTASAARMLGAAGVSALSLKPNPLFSASVTTSSAIPVMNKSGVEIGTLTLTDARLVIKEIKLKLGDEEMDEKEGESTVKIKKVENDKVKFEGPYVVNLLDNSISPSLDSVEVIAGTYKEIEMKLDKIEGDEKAADGSALVAKTDPLFGNSIYLEGTYTGSTASGTVTAVPFNLSFDMDETFELTRAGATSLGFGITKDATNPIVIAFRMLKWFAFDSDETNESGVDFSSLVVDTDSSGASLISLDKEAKENNEKIRKVIKENIEDSADYGKDSDGDGELSSKEDDDSDASDSHDK